MKYSAVIHPSAKSGYIVRSYTGQKNTWVIVAKVTAERDFIVKLVEALTLGEENE